MNNIIEQNITSTLELNYMPYAMSVIVSRAIPEIDGFKPAHRKLLYTMYKMGLLTGNRVKSADVVGQTMKLNPHGDGAIYETLVRLTRGNDAMLHPFIDSKGNFGKQYSRDMSYAASRYTEVKLSKICNEIFNNIDKNTVDFIDNYNGTVKEPTLFPTTFPNLLVTPNQGIAVGMASSICSFNLKEVCNATIAYIKDNNCDLKKYLLAPDFSTGGELIYVEKEITSIYETGRGGLKVRAKYRCDKKNSCIEIYEIPYTTTVEQIIDKIISLVKSNKIREINDVRDETDLKGLKLTIDIKKNVDPHLLMQRLYKMTTLSDSFSANFNILVKGNPLTLGVKDIIKHWLDFRIDCIKRQTSFEIEKKNAKHHLLVGMSKLLLDIDKAIVIIRQTEQEKDVLPNLMQAFEIDELQSEYIAEIKLRNLNKEYLLNRISELDSIKKEIENLESLLNSNTLISKLISSELKEISNKYGEDKRRTDIVYDAQVIDLTHESFIDDYPIKLFLSSQNYFKKISLASLRSFSEQNLKQDDAIMCEVETTNKSDILLFSSCFNVYKLKSYDLSDCKASSLGEYLPNILSLDENESILYMTATIDYSGFIIFIFENGKAAKISLDCYYTKVNRKKLANAFSNKSPLVYCLKIQENKDLLAIRDKDKAMLFNTSLLETKTTKNFSGVQVFNLKKNSKLSKVIDVSGTNTNYDYFKTSKLPSNGYMITEKNKELQI
jgi:DNA gyrase subunit A